MVLPAKLYAPFICPRTSCSDFIVSVNKYLEAKKQKISVGMRFKMRFEGDEAPERRYSLDLFSTSWFCFHLNHFIYSGSKIDISLWLQIQWNNYWHREFAGNVKISVGRF